MKQIRNPTQYFIAKMESQESPISPSIQQFVSGLINLESCSLCRCNFGLQSHIPRILVHCGHTFCTECLSEFHQKKRLRCPMCLKLIKKVEDPEFLPMNHTIITNLLKAQHQSKQSQQLESNIQKYLYTQFSNSTRQNLKLFRGIGEDPNTSLSYCVYHPQKIQHYFCLYHESPGCSTCISEAHQIKSKCKVVDVFEIRQQQQSQKKTQMRAKQRQQVHSDSSEQINLGVNKQISHYQMYSSGSSSS